MSHDLISGEGTPLASNRVPVAVLLTLAAITGVIPFAADMYLSSLPSINAEFDAPTWLGQLTLTGFLLMLGIGQLFGGSATAPVMWVLVAFRLLQGLGGAIAVVVANSSVRDRASGAAATRLFSVMLTVSALAPIIAPALGGFLESGFGWRSVFWAMAALGILTLGASILFLGESLPVESRRPLALGLALSGYGRLLRSGRFMLPMGALWLLFMFLFSYIGGASYVYQGEFGLDPAVFGLAFGATGIVLPVGAISANRLAEKVEAGRLAFFTVLIVTIGAAVVLLSSLAGASIWFLIAGMAIGLLGLGAAEPVLMSLSLSRAERHSAGSAAALMGAGQYILGAAASGIAGSLGVSGAVNWAVLLVGFAAISLLLTFLEARQGTR
ncbi:MFS transporter [Corynebacterium sp. A21]|uniref:MFS transporter n=1 Tax=Corynebacterium sp. A21 TaxID=3457318 RepID=UPI003FD0025C